MQCLGHTSLGDCAEELGQFGALGAMVYQCQVSVAVQSGGGIPVAVRHIESIIRMSEASARMQLRDYVRDDDVDLAIDVMLRSFIQSQKYSVSRSLTKKFSKYLQQRGGNHDLLLHVLGRLVQEQMDYERVRMQQQNRGMTDYRPTTVQVIACSLGCLLFDLRLNVAFGRHNC